VDIEDRDIKRPTTVDKFIIENKLTLTERLQVG
jgi:hypothetical protein